MLKKLSIAFIALVVIGMVSGGSMLLAQAPPTHYELWDGTDGTISLPMDTQESIFHDFEVTQWHIGNLMPHTMPLNPTGVPSGQYTIVSDASWFDTEDTLYLLQGSFAGIIHTRNPGDSYWNYGEGTWTSNNSVYHGTWTGYFAGGNVGDACTISMKYHSHKYNTYLPCGSITGYCTATQSDYP